jgi:hypothetical protein
MFPGRPAGRGRGYRGKSEIMDLLIDNFGFSSMVGAACPAVSPSVRPRNAFVETIDTFLSTGQHGLRAGYPRGQK